MRWREEINIQHLFHMKACEAFDLKFNILVMRDGLKSLRINSKERDKKRSTKFMTPLKVKVAGVEQRKKILKHVIFPHEM